MKMIKKFLTTARALILGISASISIVWGDDRVPSQPNIVFLLVDDLGWADVGYQGAPFNTPNIDRLARQGMVFTAAYAASPVCSPTRASIITGKHPARLKLTSHIPSLHKSWDYGRPPGNREFSTETGVKTRNWLPTSEVSIAEALKPLGYTSSYFGKWHLGHEPYHPIEQGFHEQVAVSNWGQPPSYYAPYKRAWPRGQKNSSIDLDDLKLDAEPGEYLTDRLTDEVCAFISRQKGNQPFFAFMSYYTIHTPLEPRQDLKSKGQYGGMVAALDESVSRILAHLQQEQLDDQTIVVFMSDNGGTRSRAPLRSKKGSTYEGGVREPMIVKWPGVSKPGSRCGVPVTSMDFFPSFLEMAGGSPKARPAIDGESFVPLLRGATALQREALHWHFPHRGPIGRSGAIRKGNHKLIEKFSNGKIEVYDLSADPGEKQDLAAKLPEKTEELLHDLRTWRREVGAVMPANN